MADDEQNDNTAADGESANDDYYADDESFENYVPSTIDPGWWMFIATCIFCGLLILGLSYLLWLTQKNRKQVEAERNAALERLGNMEEAQTKDVDKASVKTASTEDDFDDDSIITEIEDDDDDDSVTSVGTRATLVDLICSCGGADVTSPVTMPTKTSRHSRGVARLFNNAFGRKTQTHHLPMGSMNQDFIRHGKRSGVVVVDVDTSSVGLNKFENDKEDEEASEYHKMEEAHVASPEKLTGERVRSYVFLRADSTKSATVPVSDNHVPSEYHKMEGADEASPEKPSSEQVKSHTFLQANATESTTVPVSDYHQIHEKVPKRGFFKRFGTKKTKVAKGTVAKTTPQTPEIKVIEEKQEASSVKKEDILGFEGGLVKPETSPTKDDDVSVYHQLNDDVTSTAKTSVPVKEETEEVDMEPKGYCELQSSPARDTTLTDTDAHDGVSGKKQTKMRRGAKLVCRAIKSFGRKIRRVSAYDDEMKKLLKLAIPFTLTALVGCVSGILSVAVIGKLLGTRALSAYVTVQFAVSVTTVWLSGLLGCLTVLCSQAIGVGEKKLAGEYVQIAVVLSQILYLPQMVFWMFFIKDLILWFGFSEQTAEIGYSYTIVYLIHGFFEYASYGLHYLLEVCGHVKLSSFNSISNSVVNVVVILSVALTSNPSLQMIGIIQFVLDMIFFIILLARKGLLDEYWAGMIGSFALTNTEAVKHLLLTSIPLSIASVLSNGEYYILFLFASMLGPAEVVAWGLFGELWGGIEMVTGSFGDAAQVRCAFLLGADKPMRAKLSAQKAMLLGVTQGMMLVTFLAVCGGGGYMAGWMTNDLTIQAMVTELIPMLYIGVLFGIIGSISFALVGAQGCYGLATSVYFIGSWLVTVPLGLAFTLIGFNLEGLACACIVGNTLSGVANTFLLLDSDWYFFSDSVRQQQNKADSVSR